MKYIKTVPCALLQAPDSPHPAVSTLVTYLKITAAAARGLACPDVIDTVNIILTEVANAQRSQDYYAQQAEARSRGRGRGR